MATNKLSVPVVRPKPADNPNPNDVKGRANALLEKIHNFLAARKTGSEVDYWVEELFQIVNRTGVEPDWDKYPIGKSYYEARVAGARRKGYANPNPDVASAVISGGVAGVAAALTNKALSNPVSKAGVAAGDWVKRVSGATFERIKVTPAGKVYRGMWSYVPGMISPLQLEKDPVAAGELVKRIQSETGWTRLLSENEPRYRRERIASPKEFDPRSFRTIVRGRHRVVVGCPKGHWQPRKARCRTSMKAQAILHPLEAEKNPLLQTLLPPMNPPAAKPPFRDGQKIPVEKARQWVVSTGDAELLRQFDEAYRLQAKANRRPKYVVWRLIPIGSPRKIDAVAAMVEYGETPETIYKPPAGSKKGDKLYRHRWGEGSGREKPVPVLVAPGGKALILPLRKGQKVTDWMRG